MILPLMLNLCAVNEFQLSRYILAITYVFCIAYGGCTRQNHNTLSASIGEFGMNYERQSLPMFDLQFYLCT
jgi:hypothetical protein